MTDVQTFISLFSKAMIVGDNEEKLLGADRVSSRIIFVLLIE